MLITRNLHVRTLEPIRPPAAVCDALPLSATAAETVVAGRAAVLRILQQDDPRLLVVVGPCSIHDPKGARDYAARLCALRAELGGELEIVMRVYFEKPRTTIGWKGLINDPHLDGSYEVEEGLHIARQLLLDIADLGVPAATEFLDPIVPQYTADLITWAAIGARTTESQTHREMASGLSMPVGFKNGTSGSPQIAIDAMCAALQPHSFLGVDEHGRTSIIRTTGNPGGHLVLRGGRRGANYDATSIGGAEARLARAGLPAVMMVDCSHANSGRVAARQEDVWRDVIRQRVAGTRSLVGLMVESYLEDGSQPFPKAAGGLRYGLSITDPCLGWATTERLLRWGSEQMHDPVSAFASR
jgi:3-deoxy-7-phosphoheptulonate synthase